MDGFNRFSAIDVIVVLDGHELIDPNGKTKHYVRKGNAIQNGRKIYMVEPDYEAMKAASTLLDKR